MLVAQNHTKLILLHFHTQAICAPDGHLCSEKQHGGNGKILSHVGKHSLCPVFSILGLHNTNCIFLNVLS